MTGPWQKSKAPGAFAAAFLVWRESFEAFLVFVARARLQREEEAAYAISHGAQAQAQAQATASLPSLGPFSKFEEKKTNEKTRKVTTVKKFFSTSSSRTLKKGTKA